MKRNLKYLWVLFFVGLDKLFAILQVPEWGNYIVSGVLILVFGLPHGATDHLLYNFVRTRQISGNINRTFLTIYFSVIGTYALVWWWSPAIALIIFLLMSAYHFGETQWIWMETKSQKPLLRKVHFLLWGITLLGFLFVYFTEETNFFLSNLIDSKNVLITLDLTRNFVLPISGILLLLLTWMIYDNRSELVTQVMALSMFFLLFVLTDLIYGFAVFFGFYHAKDTIEVMIAQFEKAKLSFKWKAFFMNAWLFTLLSILGIGIIMVTFYYFQYQVHFVTLFFIMISLVTAPHMWFIERFYAIKK